MGLRDTDESETIMIHWFSPQDIRFSLLSRGSMGVANFDLKIVDFKERSRKSPLQRLSFSSVPPFQSFEIEFDLLNDSGDRVHPEERNIDDSSHNLYLGNFMDKVLTIVRKYVDYDYSRGHDDFSILIHPKDKLDDLIKVLDWNDAYIYSYKMPIDGVSGIYGDAVFNFDPS